MWWRQPDWREYAVFSDDPSVARLTMTAAAHSGPPVTTVSGGLHTLSTLIADESVVDAFHRADQDEAYSEWAVDAMNAYEATARALVARGLPEPIAANRARLVFGSNQVDPAFLSTAAVPTVAEDLLVAMADETLSAALAPYVSEALAKADDFDEDEVNRDAKGRFAPEGTHGVTDEGVAYRVVGGRRYAISQQVQREKQVQVAQENQEQRSEDTDEQMLAYAAKQAKKSREDRINRYRKAHKTNNDRLAARKAAEAAAAQQKAAAEAKATADQRSDATGRQSHARAAVHGKVDRSALLREAKQNVAAKEMERQVQMERMFASRRALPEEYTYNSGSLKTPFGDGGTEVLEYGLSDSGIKGGDTVMFGVDVLQGDEIGAEQHPFAGKFLIDSGGPDSNHHEVVALNGLLSSTTNTVRQWFASMGYRDENAVKNFVEDNSDVIADLSSQLYEYADPLEADSWGYVSTSDANGSITYVLMQLGDVLETGLRLATGDRQTPGIDAYAIKDEEDRSEQHNSLESVSVRGERQGRVPFITFGKDFDEQSVNRDAEGQFAPKTDVGVRVVNGRRYQTAVERETEVEQGTGKVQSREERIAYYRRQRGKHRANAKRRAAAQAAQEPQRQVQTATTKDEARQPAVARQGHAQAALHGTVNRAELLALSRSRQDNQAKAAQTNLQAAKAVRTQVAEAKQTEQQPPLVRISAPGDSIFIGRLKAGPLMNVLGRHQGDGSPFDVALPSGKGQAPALRVPRTVSQDKYVGHDLRASGLAAFTPDAYEQLMGLTDIGEDLVVTFRGTGQAADPYEILGTKELVVGAHGLRDDVRIIKATRNRLVRKESR